MPRSSQARAYRRSYNWRPWWLHRGLGQAHTTLFLSAMKLIPVLVAPLALSLCASAQYFSEGWKPGQPVTYEAVPTAVNGQAAPAPTSNGRARFSFSDILTSGPIGSAMGKLGVNLTEKWEKAKAEADAEIWDTRIPLITDDNYDDLIVNEPLSPEEEDSRVWFMIMYVLPLGLLMHNCDNDICA